MPEITLAEIKSQKNYYRIDSYLPQKPDTFDITEQVLKKWYRLWEFPKINRRQP